MHSSPDPKYEVAVRTASAAFSFSTLGVCITQERVSEGRAGTRATACVLEYKKHTGWLSRGCITAYLFPHPLLLCQLYEGCVCVRIRNQPWLGFTTHIIRKCAKLF
jgi:hypothetical protein